MFTCGGLSRFHTNTRFHTYAVLWIGSRACICHDMSRQSSAEHGGSYLSVLSLEKRNNLCGAKHSYSAGSLGGNYIIKTS